MSHSQTKQVGQFLRALGKLAQFLESQLLFFHQITSLGWTSYIFLVSPNFISGLDAIAAPFSRGRTRCQHGASTVLVRCLHRIFYALASWPSLFTHTLHLRHLTSVFGKGCLGPKYAPHLGQVTPWSSCSSVSRNFNPPFTSVCTIKTLVALGTWGTKGTSFLTLSIHSEKLFKNTFLWFPSYCELFPL